MVWLKIFFEILKILTFNKNSNLFSQTFYSFPLKKIIFQHSLHPVLHWVHFWGFPPHFERPQVVLFAFPKVFNLGAAHDPQGLLGLQDGFPHEGLGFGFEHDGLGPDGGQAGHAGVFCSRCWGQAGTAGDFCWGHLGLAKVLFGHPHDIMLFMIWKAYEISKKIR